MFPELTPGQIDRVVEIAARHLEPALSA